MIENKLQIKEADVLSSLENRQQFIVNQWVLQNVTLHSANNYKTSFKDIYNKFKLDTQNEIKKQTFGTYFQYAIIIQLKTPPVVSNSTGGSYYYGLNIKNIKGDYQYFNIFTNKRKLLEFDYFTEAKLLEWYNNCVVLPNLTKPNEGTAFIKTRELYKNYIYYYSISPQIPISLVRNFGLLLKKTVKDNKLPIRYKKGYKQDAGYSGLQYLLHKKKITTNESKVLKNKGISSNTFYLFIGLSTFNLLFFIYIIYTNSLDVLPLTKITDLNSLQISLKDCFNQTTSTQEILEKYIRFFFLNK